MKKVLVTGGAGFIGSHVVDRFLESNYEVAAADNLVTGNIENISGKNIKFFNIDIRDSVKLEELFSAEKPDYVIHLAAQVSVSSSVEDTVYDAEENIMSLINILELCKKYNTEKIVFSSTAAVYGIPEEVPSKESNKTAPLSPYGLSKLTGEEYIKMYSGLFGVNYVILRYANVYGPRQSAHGEAGVVSIFNDKIKADGDIFIEGDGLQTRDFVFVKDVSKANFICATENIKNETFNVSTNTDISILELFNTMKKYSEYTKDAVHKEARKGDIRNSRLDNTKLLDSTSWKPEYTLDQGLKEYLAK
ncbi:NAD-dependent epimerase/dehydratase family protein [Sebaldella sp. S0638]|uniref:NAD-dependent epimerase/dehydratase family protein n=1 Tax=Sebaldella sp. S0638 TaxID=2957809 RepID=UPI00209FD4EE|nr:NAD-dependent epimerase/dehydratase family protein [Sebaldella sp. S0638]MCP1223411.1 GDP-mannose 4,6-dehydratase [Sebaldella sp. S0638]